MANVSFSNSSMGNYNTSELEDYCGKLDAAYIATWEVRPIVIPNVLHVMSIRSYIEWKQELILGISAELFDVVCNHKSGDGLVH